jgi:xanthine dehydrogenase accessory factor
VIHGTVTIGGCVDARVTEVAHHVIADGKSRRLGLDLGDEEAWEIGLTCGGSVEVLVERVVRDDETHAAYREAARTLADGRPVVVSVPADGGQRAIVRDDSVLAAVMEGGVSRVVGEGRDRVFHELLQPARTIVIVGAGEVGRSLVVFLHELGMYTVVVDGREHLVSEGRFPLADERRAASPSDEIERIPLTPSTGIVLVAHDYKYEIPVLRRVLRSDVGYVGMLGGRKRGDAVRAMLGEEGFTAAELARLHSPIGLDLGAKTTAEIALSIAAELVRESRSPAARDRR